MARTFVVCGIERGGTSMIASMLHHLGISMGEHLDGTYEDHELANTARGYIASSDDLSMNALKRAISDRNERFNQWGFKIPNIFLNLEILEFVRNPLLVFVFRDSIAIAERVAASAKRAPEGAFGYVATLQSRLADTFACTPLPTVALSYEKVVAAPEDFVPRLAEVLAIAASSEAVCAAIARVRRSPAEYLAVAGPVDIIGHIEGFDCGDLVGWAVNLGDENETVTLTIQIDGAVIAEIDAAQPRGDLWVYCQINFNHGFRWRIPPIYYDGAVHKVSVSTSDSGSSRIASSSWEMRVPEVFGALEEFVDGTLRGWLYSWNRNAENLRATIEIDDDIVVGALANFPRDDLAPSGFTQAGGLAFEVPPYLCDGKPHRVRTIVEGCTDFHISGSPRYISFPTFCGNATVNPHNS